MRHAYMNFWPNRIFGSNADVSYCTFSVGNSVGASGGTGSLLDSLLNGSNNDTVQKLAMLAYVTNPDKGQPIMQGLLTAQVSS